MPWVATTAGIGPPGPSPTGDAKVLDDLVRTTGHNHRQVAGDSPLVEAVKVQARVHQSLIWDRQRHVNALRSALREFYPGALAPSAPSLPSRRLLPCWSWRRLPSRVAGAPGAAIRRALVGAGRRRNLQARVVTIQARVVAIQARVRHCGRLATGWSGSCMAVWPTGSLTRSRSPGRPRRRSPDRGSGGAGVQPRKYRPPHGGGAGQQGAASTLPAPVGSLPPTLTPKVANRRQLDAIGRGMSPRRTGHMDRPEARGAGEASGL
jgi:hypothetical protein